MASYTKNYNAKKPAQSENYDVDIANFNNDLWDEKIFSKQDKIVGKSLSANDFTNAYKAKLDSLKNYDDTQIKQDISNHNTRLNTLESDNTQNKQNILSIQQEQINQNSNISQNKTDIELLEENLSDEITTEEAESLAVKDAVRWYGKLDVSGNSVQEQTTQSANLWWDNTTRTFNSAENRMQTTTQKIKARHLYFFLRRF